jgi:hypothetical protein
MACHLDGKGEPELLPALPNVKNVTEQARVKQKPRVVVT